MPLNASTTIAADPGRVYELVSDITQMGRWSPENTGGEWLDGATGPRVGATFRGHNKRGMAKWSTTCEVTTAEPGQVFAFVVGTRRKPDTRWTYEFRADAAGTEVVETCELIKPLGFFSRLLTRVTTGVRHREADLVEGMQQTLARLKQAAES
ncbi:MAG TPA: SRPBCC family protein [Mycobacteriales bacterium]|nr:SRPBCC family protein [Mycobacteriales bacterium]